MSSKSADMNVRIEPETWIAFEEIRARVQRHQLGRDGNSYTFSLAVDEATTGRIVLVTNAPSNVIAEMLASSSSASPALRRAYEQVIVHHGTTRR